jgi:uncharacterized membrane protein
MTPKVVPLPNQRGMGVERTLPALRLLPTFDWRPLLVVVFVLVGVINRALVARAMVSIHVVAWGGASDWNELVHASQATNPYTADGFRRSPVAARAMAVLLPMGIGVWRVLHFAVLLWLRDWRLIALALISWPFWVDVAGGNVLTFAVVTAVVAIRGSRIAALMYLALLLLMPRPLFLPVAAWLLWQRPNLRWPFVAMFVVHLALVIGSGWAAEWAARLIATGSELDHFQNLAPSQWLGIAWVPIGLVLAGWLTLRGRLGLASLAASPYVFPYYLLFLLLETRDHSIQITWNEGLPAGPAGPST